jgi:hypothetical protein
MLFSAHSADDEEWRLLDWGGETFEVLEGIVPHSLQAGATQTLACVSRL